MHRFSIYSERDVFSIKKALFIIIGEQAKKYLHDCKAQNTPSWSIKNAIFLLSVSLAKQFSVRIYILLLIIR